MKEITITQDEFSRIAIDVLEVIANRVMDANASHEMYEAIGLVVSDFAGQLEYELFVNERKKS